MSKRQLIRNRIYRDLSLWTVNNGYNFTLKKFYKKFLALEDVKEYPTVYFAYNSESRESDFEAGTTDKCQLNLMFVGVISAEKDPSKTGIISDYCENLIDDVLNFFYNEENKGLYVLDLGISKLIVSNIETYPDDVVNKGIIVCNILIEYDEIFDGSFDSRPEV